MMDADSKSRCWVFGVGHPKVTMGTSYFRLPVAPYTSKILVHLGTNTAGPDRVFRWWMR